MGLGSHEPLEAMEELVFLCHTPCVTLLEEWLTSTHLRGRLLGAAELDGLGHVFLCLGLG
jgi:hypothetical protein